MNRYRQHPDLGWDIASILVAILALAAGAVALTATGHHLLGLRIAVCAFAVVVALFFISDVWIRNR